MSVYNHYELKEYVHACIDVCFRIILFNSMSLSQSIWLAGMAEVAKSEEDDGIRGKQKCIFYLFHIKVV